jgi:GalNAc-alpha-(1->4)-GalNAc-alpha-(1->3)-diNAcBac-PP-undecaprenol alpha-1,4-N-acetyl-D-galactosaminyltransferase
MAENRKQVIALVIPSMGPGGMERVMSELAGYFSRQSDLDVHLVLYGINRDVFYALPQNIVIHKPDFVFDNSLRFRSTLETLLFLRKTISHLQPHVVMSFGEYWNSFVLLSLVGLNYPVYVSDRCQPDKSLGLLHDILRRLLYRRAQGVIVQTEKAKVIYSAFIRQQKIRVIGNPIRSRDVFAVVQKENIVLTVGRLIQSKHHDELIRLFVSIGQPGWKLVIVGGDALKQQNMLRLKCLIDELGAGSTVELAGNRADVEQYYYKSKIFAFTSSSEGFPNVIGEAMAAGLPVVSFDCVAGPSDMLTDGVDGFLVPLFDYVCFKRKLKLLMDNKEMSARMGEKARENIEQYSVDGIGHAYHRLLISSI